MLIHHQVLLLPLFLRHIEQINTHRAAKSFPSHRSYTACTGTMSAVIRAVCHVFVDRAILLLFPFLRNFIWKVLSVLGFEGCMFKCYVLWVLCAVFPVFVFHTQYTLAHTCYFAILARKSRRWEGTGCHPQTHFLRDCNRALQQSGTENLRCSKSNHTLCHLRSQGRENKKCSFLAR